MDHSFSKHAHVLLCCVEIVLFDYDIKSSFSHSLVKPSGLPCGRSPTGCLFNPIPPGLFEGGAAWGVGGGKCPQPIIQKTINDNEMKLGGVAKDH